MSMHVNTYQHHSILHWSVYIDAKQDIGSDVSQVTGPPPMVPVPYFVLVLLLPQQQQQQKQQQQQQQNYNYFNYYCY